MFTEKQIYKYPKKLMQVGKKVLGWQENIVRIKSGVIIIINNVRSLGSFF